MLPTTRQVGQPAIRILLVLGALVLGTGIVLPWPAEIAPLAYATGTTAVLGLVAAVIPMPMVRTIAAVTAGLGLVAWDLLGVADSTAALEKIVLLHGGLLLTCTSLSHLIWFGSAGARRFAGAGIAALFVYLLLPSGGGLWVLKDRIAIGDPQLWALDLMVWLLVPLAILGLTAVLSKRAHSAVSVTTLLILWYPAYSMMELAFDLRGAESLLAEPDRLRAAGLSLVGRAWLCPGLALLVAPTRR